MFERVPGALAGQRLDRVVALIGDISRAQAAALIDAGAVRVNEDVTTTRAHRVAEGDSVAFTAPSMTEELPQPDTSVAVDVVHADEAVIVVDKPAGLVVHPGAGHPRGTLVNGLLALFPELAHVGDATRPGIVHRLDRGTSGLLAVARTAEAYGSLVAQLQSRSVERVYRALVWGHLDESAGLIDAPVGRARRDPTRMTVTESGKQARTGYRVERRFTDPTAASLLELRLETGRTHQIRVHVAAIGHPIVGDERYGGSRTGLALDRPFLHAHSLAFDHPVGGERQVFSSGLPRDLTRLLETLA